MSYEQNVVQRASARLLRRREIRERKRYDLEQELYRRQPKLRELDRAIRGTMTELTEIAVSGRAVEANGPEIAAIRQRNLELQAQRAELPDSDEIFGTYAAELRNEVKTAASSFSLEELVAQKRNQNKG